MSDNIAVKRATPVLPVEHIEPVLAFWEKALGFERAVEVPHGEALGFVALGKGTVEIMYQTYASIGSDIAAYDAPARSGKTFLFVEVEDLAAVESALAGFDRVFPRRETFYGSTEIGYREPGGHFVTFAQFKR
jgi:catechol 2,3-dioxygenase-like lactoylglutathione lyase family enzyme